MTTQRHSDAVLRKLRQICLALTKTAEVAAWGHPNFRVANKTFAVLEEYKGKLSIAFKVAKEHQYLFLKDPRFYRTPYIGQHGWVSLITEGPVNWNEVRQLVSDSYRLVAPPRILSQMDGKHAQVRRTPKK